MCIPALHAHRPDVSIRSMHRYRAALDTAGLAMSRSDTGRSPEEVVQVGRQHVLLCSL